MAGPAERGGAVGHVAAGPPPGEPAPQGAPAPPGRLVLIGTGHVFAIENAVHQAIVALAPDVVFVELDRGRLEALIDRRRGGNAPKAKASWIHRKLQQFQEGVAGMYGAEVGSEMLGAVAAAQGIGARVMLIDPPADATVKRVLADLGWRERMRALGMLVKGIGQAAWSGIKVGRRRRDEDRARIEAEIRKYQEDPEAALAELKRTFPTVHRIVIEERDAMMARRIRKGLAGARLGVAVVVDGHVNGMVQHLADLQPEVHRLRDVREGRLPGAPPVAVGTSETVAFGFDAKA